VKEYAYGSNMCSGRFRAYDVSPEREGRALRYFERIGWYSTREVRMARARPTWNHMSQPSHT
jgi:hypothetical protein